MIWGEIIASTGGRILEDRFGDDAHPVKENHNYYNEYPLQSKRKVRRRTVFILVGFFVLLIGVIVLVTRFVI